MARTWNLKVKLCFAHELCIRDAVSSDCAETLIFRVHRIGHITVKFDALLIDRYYQCREHFCQSIYSTLDVFARLPPIDKRARQLLNNVAR